ncbi:hypothetical protein LCGC14_1790820 [marine sediment metagenome]|uniref:Uncharacterized protein n=1 Tax=marine sediment metagenome TaxID=412755 RepID=A0A0F9JS84_9ZZZZ
MDLLEFFKPKFIKVKEKEFEEKQKFKEDNRYGCGNCGYHAKVFEGGILIEGGIMMYCRGCGKFECFEI